MKRGQGIVVIAALGLFLAGFSSPVFAAESLEHTLGKIPVQHGGRVKPYFSFARESALLITGKTSFEGEDPTTLLWRWAADPQAWSQKPLLYVGHLELRKYFSGDLEHNRISPVLVLNDLEFKKLVTQAQVKQEKKEKLSQLEQKQLELFNRARFFEEISSGRMPGFVPHPEDPKAGWLPLEAFASGEGIDIAANLYPRAQLEHVSFSLTSLLDQLKSSRTEEAVLSGKRFSQSLERLLLSRDLVLDQNAVNREFLYWRLRPFHLAWISYLVSLILWIAPRKTRQATFVALFIFVLGFGVHTFGFILRILIAGRPPVTNMYESVIWVAWGSAFFSIVFFLLYRSTLLPAIAAGVATIGLLIGENFPALLDPSIAPLVPVLRSNYWLTIHVLTITLGYSAFLFNWGIAHVLLYGLAFRKEKEFTEPLTEYLYRSLQVGLILLASGTILGGVWAAESWGRFWGWDPKETWALIAVLAYLAVLHSRTAGWLDAFGVAFWCAVSFLTILMAWYGVNFVLGAGLHSYGFGGGGLPYVLTFVSIDILVILWFARRLKQRTG